MPVIVGAVAAVHRRRGAGVVFRAADDAASSSPHGRRGVRSDDLGQRVLRLRDEPRAGDGRGVRAADRHPRALGARHRDAASSSPSSAGTRSSGRSSWRRSSLPATCLVTSLVLTVPLYLLYELSIVLSWLVFRKRQRGATKRAARATEARRERARAGALACSLLALLAAVQAGAQVVPRPPTRQPPTRPACATRSAPAATRCARAADSTAAADTTRRSRTSLPPDSVMQRLMSLPGYSVTRYQGEIITFDAATRGASLDESRRSSQRDSQLVKSDTIVYNGLTQVRAGAIGKRNVFVVPGQAAPIVTTRRGELRHRRRGASPAAASAPSIEPRARSCSSAASDTSPWRCATRFAARTTSTTTSRTASSPRATTRSPTTTSRRRRSSGPARSSSRGPRCSTSATCR